MLHQGKLIVYASTGCKVLTFITKVEKTSIWISDPWFSTPANREINSFYPQDRQIYSEINKFTIQPFKFMYHYTLASEESCCRLRSSQLISEGAAGNLVLRWKKGHWRGVNTQFRESLLQFCTDEWKHKDRKRHSNHSIASLCISVSVWGKTKKAAEQAFLFSLSSCVWCLAERDLQRPVLKPRRGLFPLSVHLVCSILHHY